MASTNLTFHYSPIMEGNVELNIPPLVVISAEGLHSWVGLTYCSYLACFCRYFRKGPSIKRAIDATGQLDAWVSHPNSARHTQHYRWS